MVEWVSLIFSCDPWTSTGAQTTHYRKYTPFPCLFISHLVHPSVERIVFFSVESRQEKTSPCLEWGEAITRKRSHDHGWTYRVPRESPDVNEIALFKINAWSACLLTTWAVSRSYILFFSLLLRLIAVRSCWEFLIPSQKIWGYHSNKLWGLS